jgi:hypothetical protein
MIFLNNAQRQEEQYIIAGGEAQRGVFLNKITKKTHFLLVQALASTKNRPKPLLCGL